jgi:lambda family phage portal protein
MSTAPARGPSLNAFDRFVSYFSARGGVERLRSRMVLAHYEAAKPGKQRRFRSTSGAPDTLVQASAVALRNQVRFLERNHDITRGALATLVANTVGPTGIGVEFQPRRLDGSIHTEYAEQLQEAYRDWQRRPEVTWQHDWPSAQRILARTWLRDGEAFSQRIMGRMASLDHGTRVPYSLELIEPDLIPHDYDDQAKRIRQGCERSEWGRTLAYWVYKGHPEDTLAMRTGTTRDMKRVPSDRMLHLAQRDRIGQLRGVSVFASVITRLEDIKDYEESERVAAKVAAMMTGYVKRNSPDGYDSAGMETDENGNLKPRDLRLSAGTIIDTLAVGEEIGLIDSTRPNPNLVTFREGQLRAFAAGISASFSSVSRNYNGTYSAQRQELVEQWIHYAVLTDMFTSQAVRPVIEDFILVADMSGVAPMPKDLKLGSHDDILFIAPSMPWIDPGREMTAFVASAQAGFASEYEILRKQGKNPRAVLEQITEWRRLSKERGLVFNSDAANLPNGAQAADGGQQKNDPPPTKKPASKEPKP